MPAVRVSARPRIFCLWRARFESLQEGRIHPMTNGKIAIQILRSALAIILGEILLYAGTWFVQEPIFGHVTYSDSVPTLIGAGLLTPVAAVVAGFAVAFVAGTRPYLHLVPMSVLIVAETVFLYFRGLVDGPIWFEASAGLSLILGAMAGAYLWRHFVSAGHSPHHRKLA
jgi:hypothetical protein